jgi:two-component system phosphate regulon response regulator PhoB
MTDELRVGDFVVDRQNMVLTVAGRLAELTSTELKLVSYLMSNPDVVHSRSELLNAVWGYADDTHSRTLDTHVKRLRDKLGDHGVHIGTVRKQGYLFVSNVRKETAA